MRNVLEGTHCGSGLLQVLLKGADGVSAGATGPLTAKANANASYPAHESAPVEARTVHTFKVSILSIGGLPGKEQLEQCGGRVPIGRYVR
jgi:hypothetical protein